MKGIAAAFYKLLKKLIELTMKFFKPFLEKILISSFFAFLYALSHIFNFFALESLTISDHVSAVYLPAFFRVADVLILGVFWGTLTTGLGGLLLALYLQTLASVDLFNILASASSGALGIWIFKKSMARDVSLASLPDLVKLSGLCAIANALVHHLAWSLLKPDWMINKSQVFWMILGDFLGALLGALLFKKIVSWIKLDHWAYQRLDKIEEDL
jgi:hypothetical protein